VSSHHSPPPQSASGAFHFTLYSYWRSGASWRTRIALAYKRLEYTTVPINLLLGEQTAPEFLARNPQRKVPLLIVDEAGRGLSQSLAIVDYLEQSRPDAPSLMPKDPCKEEELYRGGVLAADAQ
jgi:maleylacetoacetate isomerase